MKYKKGDKVQFIRDCGTDRVNIYEGKIIKCSKRSWFTPNTYLVEIKLIEVGIWVKEKNIIKLNN
jgi:hypothetical protein